MIEQIKVCDDARVPVIWFVTHEEGRAETELVKYATEGRKRGSVWVWSLTSNDGLPGWEPADGNSGASPFDDVRASMPETAVRSFVDYARQMEENSEGSSEEESAVINSRLIAIFRDPHAFINDNFPFMRALRDASTALRNTDAMIVCISPKDGLPIDFKTDVELVYPGLPDKEAIKKTLTNQLDQLAGDEGYGIEIDYEEQVPLLVEACAGLTLIQATDALHKSLTQTGEIDIPYVSRIKTEAISSVPGLTYIGDTPTMADVGGLANMKEWVIERKEGFTQRARDAHLPMPKGMLVLGIPGNGKSLSAKAISNLFGYPLISLNLPDLKGGIVGETESNFRQVRSAIMSIGKCVVWMDEFEKGLPKLGDRNLDSGVSDALLKGMLTYMQERNDEAFIVATANSISSLPPELLRRGRWDAIFFVDLPNEEERAEIFRIHLAKLEQSLTQKEILDLAAATEKYSGAEIEASCIDGLWKAFGKGRKLIANDVLESVKENIPISTTMKEQIDFLSKWAKTNARSASNKSTKVLTPLRKKGRKLTLEKVEKGKVKDERN